MTNGAMKYIIVLNTIVGNKDNTLATTTDHHRRRANSYP